MEQISKFIEQTEKLLTATDRYVNATEKELDEFCDYYFKSDSEIDKYCVDKNIPLEKNTDNIV
ncbi:hypothetical protein [Patiriisocius sp. Uisw_047]|uniref:hypothetical protein n=1 Tax=Patiriisocius sp. Uisw_047 TaxID=3230969 RepID=UPI0039EABED4